MSLPKPAHKRRISGQSMTEYIIIVFLVGIGTIALVTLFGDNVRALFASSAESLAGNPLVKNSGQMATNPKFDMKGGSTNPYETGSCGVSGCSTTGP
jgi:pilus assembly protein Flp/PilA